jgi:transposase
MALGKRKTEQQQELFIPADRLPRSPGHVFYRKLNGLLAEAAFDAWLEECCRPFYADGQGREGIPPGTYFRMLLVGYFEGIGSQRGIAWRSSDSLSIRDFLGVPAAKESPDHSSLSRIRERLPFELHLEVFAWILKLADEKKLLARTRRFPTTNGSVRRTPTAASPA